MMLMNDIIVIKFGGDVITDKSHPLSIKKAIIRNLVSDLKDFLSKTDTNIIIVHGGGSFGHPMAKKYLINKGKNSEIDNQNIGLVETHQAMIDLNNHIMSELKNQNLPAISFAPVSQFYKQADRLVFTGLPQIQASLELNIIPVLYGDILLHTPHNFSILSGDQIISSLCMSKLKKSINRVIFTMKTEGFLSNFSDTSQKPEIIKNIPFGEDIEHLIRISEKNIDVTGGMKIKISEIQKITECGIPVSLISGIERRRLYDELIKKNEIKTIFLPKQEF